MTMATLGHAQYLPGCHPDTTHTLGTITIHAITSARSMVTATLRPVSARIIIWRHAVSHMADMS